MKKSFVVAIAGATGAVGRVMLSILEDRNFPIERVHLLASERSAGERLYYKEEVIKVERLDQFDFSKVDIAFFSAGGSVSEQFVPKAAKAGCYVIDNTSFFRYDDDIPLIVPEVNLHCLDQCKNRRIIANPNCSTIQMLVALKPIYDAVGIERINVATYQSVSGAGQQGVSTLADESIQLLSGKNIENENASPFSAQIAFNAIPQIDQFQDNGYTKEEMKMVWETRKIFEDESIEINPTCVRIPVFHAHSEAVHIETKEYIDAENVRKLLREAKGVIVIDDIEEMAFPTPVHSAANEDAVYVGRIRNDISHARGINLWVVADNVRKGAALNSVQIAEALIEAKNVYFSE